SAIKSLRHLSVNQKDLSDLNKRIQDHQELAVAYSNWIELVRSHELAAVHGMLWSFLLIALILLAVYIAGRIVDHFIIDVKHEWTQISFCNQLCHRRPLLQLLAHWAMAVGRSRNHGAFQRKSLLHHRRDS